MSDTSTSTNTQPTKSSKMDASVGTLFIIVGYVATLGIMALTRFGRGEYVRARASDVECQTDWFKRLWLHYFNASNWIETSDTRLKEWGKERLFRLFDMQPVALQSNLLQETAISKFFQFFTRYDAGRRIMALTVVIGSLVYANHLLQTHGGWWQQLLIMFGIIDSEINVRKHMDTRPVLFDMMLSGFRVAAMALAVMAALCAFLFGVLAMVLTIFTDRDVTQEHFHKILTFVFSYAGAPIVGRFDPFGVFDMGLLLLGAAAIGVVLAALFGGVRNALDKRHVEDDDVPTEEEKVEERMDKVRAAAVFTVAVASVCVVLRAMFFYREQFIIL